MDLHSDRVGSHRVLRAFYFSENTVRVETVGGYCIDVLRSEVPPDTIDNPQDYMLIVETEEGQYPIAHVEKRE